MNDADFVVRQPPGHLCINPGKHGAYASIADESEVVLGEVDVTDRFKLAVSAFYVEDKADFGTFKITKLKWHKNRGWEADGHIQVNYFHLAQIHQFLSIIASVDLSQAKRRDSRSTIWTSTRSRRCSTASKARVWSKNSPTHRTSITISTP